MLIEVRLYNKNQKLDGIYHTVKIADTLPKTDKFIDLVIRRDLNLSPTDTYVITNANGEDGHRMTDSEFDK